MSSQDHSMQTLLVLLKEKLPGVSFEPGDTFFWSPEHSSITYKCDSEPSCQSDWSLLHEASHALLEHQRYNNDVELLLMEVAAWKKAKELAKSFSVEISEDHIQDCLDTYRDWLHQRATCPRCSTVSLQVSTKKYRCHNCFATWSVSKARFCRPYRLSNASSNKKSPETVPLATFQ